MRTLNLGILAHVDAGKTTLTEHLLHRAGVIDVVGSVDAGSTRTDSLELERRRGITIRSAVVSFTLPDPDPDRGTDEPLTVNLVDTPGHPDFIAEVERVLDVLDGAVLLVSAVEGVQPQTRVLSRALRRLGVPFLVLVNKIDRRGARSDALVAEVAGRLGLRPLPIGRATGLGTRAATAVALDPDDPGTASRWAEVLADADDDLLAEYVDGCPSPSRVHAALAAQTARGLVHPLLYASAATGEGVDAVLDAVARWLPAHAGDPTAPLTGRVFKVQRAAGGEKLAWVRLHSGTLRTRDRVFVGERESKVTGIEVLTAGATERVQEVGPGRVAVVSGLAAARVGDPVGEHPQRDGGSGRLFAPPTLETVVVPAEPSARGALHLALTELAEQDPLIAVRRHGEDELAVSLYGEVQKEVIEATLAVEHGLRVRFRETTTVCVEQLTGTGAAVEPIGAPANPYLAGVGLRVEPAPAGSGGRYRVDGSVLGRLPLAFFTAIEETVHTALEHGRHGWRVVDCAVTLTSSGYYPRQSHSHATFDKAMSSTAGDFRHLTPLVLVDALRAAGTEVLEPVHRISIELPAEGLSPVLALVTALGGVPDAPVPRGVDWVLGGEVPAGAVHLLAQRLPGLTSGEGVLEWQFSRYRPVQGPVPERTRTDPDPRHRKEYLLRVRR